MANIRDIAKITGYSVSTISRVINNHPYVDDKKREKVLKVMAELNYVPNRSAQNLSFGKTKNIGVIDRGRFCSRNSRKNEDAGG